MIRTLIADDDALLRAALRTMVDWEALGYTLVWDCTNGLQVLELLQRTTVDLLITDMKMPLLDGLGLIRRLRQSALLLVTVVLSGYDEYELVQEAFRLGAHDYLLKGNLDTASLTAMLTELRRRIFADGGTAAAPAAGPQLAPGSYGVAVFAVDDMARRSDRFGGDLKNRLDKPMLELVRQIPRVAGRATLRAAGPGQYELLWQVRDKAPVCAPLLNALGAQRDEDYEAEKEAFFRTREPLDGPAQTQLMLVLLTQITEAQRKCGLDAENTAGCEAVVQALGTPWERSVWLRNLLRKERERLQHRSRSQTPDPIRRAQIFLEDNFTDHNLTLKAVADQVGLNEKYLSTQFTRRCGCTFISYLNNLRLRYAQELLARTDLKIYEISDRVGYSRFPRLLPI